MKSTTANTPRVLLNDFARQWSATQDLAMNAFKRVNERGWFILGPEVKAFEKALADFWQLDYAVGCGNGMDAIEIGLRAAGLRPGDTVLTTPVSAFATTLAVLRAEGRPAFVDVDETGLLDLGAARAYLARNPQTRFLLPVHLYGHALDLQSLQALRDEFGLQIVEDCAQAVGARSRGVPVGAVGVGAATSFYPTKNLGCLGDGGAFLTDRAEIAEKARTLRDYGQSEKYVHSEIGLNSRLDELQASLLHDCFLPRLVDLTTARVRIASHYLNALKHPNIKPLPTPPGSESVWHLFPVRVHGDRESFRRHLAQAGIETAVHYPVTIPAQAALNKVIDVDRGDFPGAAALCASEVSLPIHPYLTEEEVQRVVAACNSWTE